MTCGALPLTPCTTDDVVRGLGQVSDQLHGLAAFLLVVCVVVVILLTFTAATLFVNGNR